jgi:cobalt-zinc-cadmium efflux system outer membrane protein
LAQVGHEEEAKFMDRKILPLLGALLLSGCLYSGYKKADQAVCDMAAQPFDMAPPSYNTHVIQTSSNDQSSGAKSASAAPAAPLAVETDSRTAALLGQDELPRRGLVETLKMPFAIPGAETPLIDFKGMTEAQREAYIRRLYPELPPLPEAPAAVPGPTGCPLTLIDLQRLAVENSPTLKIAADNVVAAKGNMIQAGMYPNPNATWSNQPNNNNATAGAIGAGWEQLIKTAGKLKLQQAAAVMDLDNAKLAEKRARSDLSTSVRNAYFALLVSKETVRVDKALAEFTYKVYRVSVNVLQAKLVPSYEPAALQGQYATARLAYLQAIQNYLYNWEQLRAAIGLRQLPLTQVAGRIDACIPYYDYTGVLAHVLKNHTDVLTAGNGIKKAEYNLKFAQVTPIPDPDVMFNVWKESTVAPFTWFYQVTVGVPMPIWDQNKGGILAAQGNLMAAKEEPHRVEMALTTTLAGAYANYKTNLQALEEYRRNILPNMVRVYRGILERRNLDVAGVAFADLVTAQQTLAGGVATYLATLGALWTSVVGVADLLQTDDLFQVAHPVGVEPISNLLQLLPPLPCNHSCDHAPGPPPPGPGLPPAGPAFLPPAGPVVPPPAGAPPAEVLPQPREANRPAARL